MAKVVLYMSMSLDGFITGPNDDKAKLVPVLPGEGRRLFDRLGAEHIELELTRTIDAPGVQHLRYRVETTKRADTPRGTARRRA